MDEHGARALLERVATDDPPPPRVDIGHARSRGRRVLRRRLALLPGGAAMMAAAVAGLVASGAVPLAPGATPGTSAQVTSLAGVAPPGTQWVYITASSAANVWALGEYGKRFRYVMVRWDGTAWKRLAVPRLPVGANIHAIGTASASDGWLVGAGLGPSPIERWNGKSWHPVSGARLHSPGGLAYVRAISASDAWAVGYTSAAKSLARPFPLIEHWNGTAWRRVAVAGHDSGVLLGEAGRSPGNSWAFGQRDKASLTPILERRTGTTWRPAPSPRTAAWPYVSGIAAISASDAWAVGKVERLTRHALIEHWNGRAWRLVASPGAAGSDLVDVAATSADDVWAVGQSKSRTMLILHWDGTRWRRMHIAGPARGYVDGVVALSPRDAWAITVTGRILHWDGTGWR